MPATKKSVGGQWGITWAEIEASEVEYAAKYRCQFEWVCVWVRLSPRSERRVLSIGCYAISGRSGSTRISGYGGCLVGGNRGAASVPGAYLRSMMDAAEDLETRRDQPAYNRDNPVATRISWE